MVEWWIYPLDRDEYLHCTRCDEKMNYNKKINIFQCGCRKLGVSSEAISIRGAAEMDTEVREYGC